ncbi:hypothetical protein [Peptacetobacter sp.]|uniref:hypothetical protein n=1 Tax=Peptacetobacter sp. TaxID=2991975 RepID=UPI0026093405|nr:hypothetical protein [Peptacetobacter sp.]
MKIFETIFDICYLITIITVGIKIIKSSKKGSHLKLFGIMAIVLGCGDAFHLVPRVYSLWTVGINNDPAALGFGEMVASITMTIFYVILYNIWEMRYDIKNDKTLKTVIYLLAIVRIILCLLPQNDWFAANPPHIWGIYRNIPFVIMGLLIIIIFYKKAKENKDSSFRYMWLAITLSFGFYIPVVLYAHIIPAVGALMMPKTLAYVWIVFMGYNALKNSKEELNNQ